MEGGTLESEFAQNAKSPKDYLVIEDAESEPALALVEDDLLDEGGPHGAAVERLQRLGQPLRRGAKQQNRVAGSGLGG